ncbi:hypothetical protein ACGFI9_03465 [Micromonospora sp. NPDC048930]|uniref:hypothetical protein n=1 Tax=Micromonospora sp. NPDC048930 TaxID=3364261 RepID=UPI003711C68F
MGATEVVLAESGSIRPEVPIPLAPLRGPARMARRLTVGPGWSSFERARNVTLGWLAAAVLAVIVDRLLVDHVLATVAAVTLVGYTIARAAALVLVERRQYAFEWRWLEDQSRRLRRQPFEVVAVRVQVVSDDVRSAVRAVDLTDPADVAWLLDQQAAGAGASSQARIEFGYWETGGSGRSSDSVRRRLADLQVHPVDAPITRARIRFPQARYVTVDGGAGSGGCWPGRVAHWSLVGPVQLTTARAA